MATRKQDADKVGAEKSAPTPATAPDKTKLIEVTKGGITLSVHPTNVAAHQAAGWTVA